ncbi:hypothetical protein DM02DRAFT_23429 [Periconia macrospinosa]|uniref:Secreted protein n=1 Tax=Periconia macrospinosa TaxID=97972 RepID=A0A2V1DPE3_9PLEO|nr:hypothetical protein DM02DRAFT_23429 [Periconia macrospinosa]
MHSLFHFTHPHPRSLTLTLILPPLHLLFAWRCSWGYPPHMCLGFRRRRCKDGRWHAGLGWRAATAAMRAMTTGPTLGRWRAASGNLLVSIAPCAPEGQPTRRRCGHLAEISTPKDLLTPPWFALMLWGSLSALPNEYARISSPSNALHCTALHCLTGRRTLAAGCCCKPSVVQCIHGHDGSCVGTLQVTRPPISDAQTSPPLGSSHDSFPFHLSHLAASTPP